MKNPGLLFQLLLSFVLILGGCVVPPIPLPCHCGTPQAPKITFISANQAIVTWKAWAGNSEIHLKNIETQQDTVISLNMAGSAFSTFTYTFSGLSPATTYSAQVKVPCGKGCPTSLTPISQAQLFSTDPLASSCAAPILFNVYNVKSDTILFSWQSANTATDFRLYVADSLGNVVYNQPFNLLTTSMVNVKIQKTSLPVGDYTAWIETDCGSMSSMPSNMAVFGMRTGGGPVVVIDDDLSVYRNSGNLGNILNLPDIKTTTSCINSRNVSFQNTTNPKQIIIAYAIPGNTNLSCAPTSSLSRLRSYKVNSVQSNLNSPYYRISIPRISCLCPTSTYKVSVLANDNYVPFNTANISYQYCTSCQ